jgi:hypothetical protein
VILRVALLAIGALSAAGLTAHVVTASRSSLKTKASPITPPGLPQPSGVIAIPSPPASSSAANDPLHQAARTLLTKLSGMAPSKAPFPECRAFQNTWNLSNPSTRLNPDGKYGGKCQAALQSLIAPAIAPANFFPGGTAPVASGGGPVVVAKPLVPVAPATPGMTLSQAATILAAAANPGKASDTRVRSFQNAYNLTPGVTHLVPDGKYGGSTQGALQSVLDFLGGGLQAPPNAFGGVAYVGSPPIFPPGRVASPPLDPSLAALGPLAAASGQAALETDLGY